LKAGFGTVPKIKGLGAKIKVWDLKLRPGATKARREEDVTKALELRFGT